MKIALNSTTGILARYANRHGLITGQTGTGKSVTLLKLAQEFSTAGIPVFVSDVKSDLSAIARACPTDVVDLLGQSGRPIKVTFAAMGADLVARALELSDVQSACVEIAFAVAAETGARLDSIADFRHLLAHMSAQRESISRQYGQVSGASIGVVMRSLLRLESQGGNEFFGAPAFDVAEMLQAGKVTLLAADKLIASPRLYSAFLLYMLTDLYARLPEIGDTDKPRLVFFFDEAHLLFSDCPAALLQRIEQTVRLIRSKGVGVYFVTQSPDDVPPLVREQLAHKIEHSRALPVGSAKVSTMDSSGRPLAPVVVKVALPGFDLGPIERVQAATIDVPAFMEAPDMTAHGYAFLIFAAVAILAIIGGVAWLWGSGLLFTVACIGAGILLGAGRAFK